MTTARHNKKRPAFTTKRLAYELDQEISIKFEEGLHTQALAFLKDILHSGVSAPASVSHARRPISIARPEHLAFIITLALHPSFTNRARDPSAASVSVAALDYLHAVDRLVVPSEARYAEAYTWSGSVDSTTIPGNSRRSLRRRQDDDRGGAPASNNGQGDLFTSNATGSAVGEMTPNSAYATTRAVWNCAPDFWAVVGWAFRCSISHPRRWRTAWRPWLEYFIGVLEQDWDEWELRRRRERRRENSTKRSPSSSSLAKKGQEDEEDAKQSLFARYHGKSDARARVLRAIFADGSDRSGSEFKEIWRNETKPAPRPLSDLEAHKMAKRKSNSREFNIDEDAFGDYLDPSSQEEDDHNEEDDEAGDLATHSLDDNEPFEPGQKRKRGRPPSKKKLLDPQTTSRSRSHRSQSTRKDTHATQNADPVSDSSDNFANTPASSESLALWGGHAAGLLRLRLLSLTVRLAESRAEDSNDGASDELIPLFSRTLDYIRPLPLEPLTAAFAPTTLTGPVRFPHHLATALLQYLTHTIIQGGQKTAAGDRGGGSGGGGWWWWGRPMTQEVLVKRYLPFAANTNLIVDNARVSICVEFLMGLLLMGDDDDSGRNDPESSEDAEDGKGKGKGDDGEMDTRNGAKAIKPVLTWMPGLEEAVETGIAAREAKATRAKGVKGEASGSSSEVADRAALEGSAARLRVMVEMLRP